MAEQARLWANSETMPSDEVPRQEVAPQAAGTADLGHLIAHLLGAPLRHGLEVATALGRMAGWEEIARAQAELFQASLAWWTRPSHEDTARPARPSAASRRARAHTVSTVVKRRCPAVARPDETVQAAVARMTAAACGSILVCEDDRLCGIFTERHLMTRVVGAGLDPTKVRLAEVMTRDPDRIESSETVVEVLRRLDGLAHQLPVVEGGRALGVISPDDLPLETLARLLPELERQRVLAEVMR